MNSQDVELLITFFIMLIPFGVLWYIVIRRLKKYIKTALNYSVLILLSLISVAAYYLLCFLLSDNFLKGEISNLIGATSFATAMLCELLIIPTFIVTFVLTIIHFISRINK